MSNDDPIYEKAVSIAKARKRLEHTLLQRELCIGCNRAIRLLKKMEQLGVLTHQGNCWELASELRP